MEDNFKRTNTIARIERIIEIVKNAVDEETSNRETDKSELRIYYTAHCFFDDIDFYTHEEIGEPGYTMHQNGVILVAYSWNIPHCIEQHEYLNDLFRRMIRLFEKISELYWGESWSRCGDCSKLYLTQPDCMHWTPRLYILEAECVCSSCIIKHPASYIQNLVNNKTEQDTIEIDEDVYEKLGYKLLLDSEGEAEEFTVGFYKPKDLITKYNKAGYREVIVQLFNPAFDRGDVYRVFVDSNSLEDVKEKNKIELQKKMKSFSITCSQDEYQDHVDCYDGICFACGEWIEGGTEPDAQNYLCPYCGEKAVQGVEIALVGGHIEFTE